MRTNIEIDDELIRAAMRVGGLKTKRSAVEEGLRLLIRLKGQAEVRSLFEGRRTKGSESIDTGALGQMACLTSG